MKKNEIIILFVCLADLLNLLIRARVNNLEIALEFQIS